VHGRKQRGLTAWVGERPDERLGPGRANRQPQVEQRGAAAQVQGTAARVGYPQHPVWITVQLDEVVAGDPQPPWLGVVNRRRGRYGPEEPPHDAVVR